MGETVESTWYVHADGVEHVVTVPEEDDTSSDDTSSLDYLSHSEVMAMVPPGFSGRHFLVPTDSVSSEFVFGGMLLPVDFVDESGYTCKTGVTRDGFAYEANYCDRDADYCNGKQVNVLYNRDVVLSSEPGGQPLYWIDGLCLGNATSVEVSETVHMITCPFTVDTYTEVSITFPAFDSDFEMLLVPEVTGQCPEMCPNRYDIACLMEHECYQIIGIMMLSLTFFCAGVLCVCCIVSRKRKALKEHVEGMRKSKTDPSSSTRGVPTASSWNTAPEMLSQRGAPTLSSCAQPVMSMYGAPQMQVQCSQYGAQMIGARIVRHHSEGRRHFVARRQWTFCFFFLWFSLRNSLLASLHGEIVSGADALSFSAPLTAVASCFLKTQLHQRLQDRCV